MNASDVVGSVIDGTYYCPTCAPSDGGEPVFHDQETDSPSHCEVCDELIQETFTKHAINMMLDRMEDYLTKREGRKEILHQWAAGLEGYELDMAQEKVRDLCFWATSNPREV